MTTIFESVAAELDAMEREQKAESLALKAQDYHARHCYHDGIARGYREAAALLRARALPAMDREGLVTELVPVIDSAMCYTHDTTTRRQIAIEAKDRAEEAADAILARFAPPAPVTREQFEALCEAVMKLAVAVDGCVPFDLSMRDTHKLASAATDYVQRALNALGKGGV